MGIIPSRKLITNTSTKSKEWLIALFKRDINLTYTMNVEGVTKIFNESILAGDYGKVEIIDEKSVAINRNNTCICTVSVNDIILYKRTVFEKTDIVTEILDSPISIEEASRMKNTNE